MDRRRAIAAMPGVLFGACRQQQPAGPTIQFTRIPQADQGGREKHEIIEGLAIGARPDHRVVLYARSGAWWVQPLGSAPFTSINRNHKWSNATHLGTEYAALLVEPGYKPPAKTEVLPTVGQGVAAVTIVPGQATAPSAYLRFSGYEWRLRDAPSDRGGYNLYSPSNVSTDAEGRLHLRISRQGSAWTCSEMSLTRSLGYGTYTFVVQDISHLEPAAVFGLFTWDYSGAGKNFRELSIEFSRWGDPTIKNAQYVVQPYSVASNVWRFTAPAGRLVHSLVWEPGRASFRTVRGGRKGTKGDLVSEHVFTSGVPEHGIESIRMNLYAFSHAKTPLQNEAEVVVDRFEYLP